MELILKHPLAWGLIAFFIFIGAIIFHYNVLQHNVMASIVDEYKKMFKGKLDGAREFAKSHGEIENTSFIYKLDRLILTSGIRSRFKKFSVELFALIELLMFTSGLMTGLIFTKFIFAILIGLIASALPYCILLYSSGKTYNKLEDQTSLFISLLANHAKTSTDITSIMKATIPSLSEPMRTLATNFVIASDQYGSTDIAFKQMKESIDNRQLKTVIVNLQNCSHYQANYEEVLRQMMNQVLSGLSAREQRKNILMTMRLSILVITVIEVVIVKMISGTLAVPFFTAMTTNPIGQILLFITGLLYLFLVIRMFTTDKQ